MKCFLCGTSLISHNASDVKESACKRCYPNYGEEVKGGTISKVIPTERATLKPLTSIHHTKKHVANNVKKGVRYY